MGLYPHPSVAKEFFVLSSDLDHNWTSSVIFPVLSHDGSEVCECRVASPAVTQGGSGTARISRPMSQTPKYLP